MLGAHHLGQSKAWVFWGIVFEIERVCFGHSVLGVEGWIALLLILNTLHLVISKAS